MKKLVVVADDYGLTNSVNLGIIRAYTEGIVSEVSLMLDYPGSEEGISLLESRRIKNVGIHLLLKGWKKTGKILRKQDYIRLFKEKSYEEIKKLAQKELETFERILGYKPTHICPQYGIHGNLKLLGFIIEYSKRFGIPVRIPISVLGGGYNNENYAAEIMLKRNRIKTTDYLFGYGPGADLTYIKGDLLEKLKKVEDNESAEIFTHPGYFDKELLERSSLAFERARDLALCINKSFKGEVEKLGFNIISYSKL